MIIITRDEWVARFIAVVLCKTTIGVDMSLFVIPIAVAGLKILPIGSNPDLFVLSLPLSLEQDALAMFAFIGGFSSATSKKILLKPDIK